MERNASTALLVLVFLIGSSTLADEPPLDDLLKRYQSLELPLPSKGATLFRFDWGNGGSHKNECLAFEIKPRTKFQQQVLLRGLQQWTRSPTSDVRAVSPERSSLDGVSVSGADALILAIQCHSQGRGDLAGALLERVGKTEQAD